MRYMHPIRTARGWWQDQHEKYEAKVEAHKTAREAKPPWHWHVRNEWRDTRIKFARWDNKFASRWLGRRMGITTKPVPEPYPPYEWNGGFISGLAIMALGIFGAPLIVVGCLILLVLWAAHTLLVPFALVKGATAAGVGKGMLFRKTWKAGPVKTTLTKSGLGIAGKIGAFTFGKAASGFHYGTIRLHHGLTYRKFF